MCNGLFVVASFASLIVERIARIGMDTAAKD